MSAAAAATSAAVAAAATQNLTLSVVVLARSKCSSPRTATWSTALSTKNVAQNSLFASRASVSFCSCSTCASHSSSARARVFWAVGRAG